FPNVIVQLSASTAAPVVPAQVLVSSISSQNPGTAIQVPVIFGQSNTMPNQVPEVYTQGPDASNQGSLSAEEHRQKVMDAAEALLMLHNSPEALQETRRTPGTYLDPWMRNRERGWGVLESVGKQRVVLTER
ncbi:doublesex- and mab-3-related transcription factor C1-like, partial [Mus pahari]|uniref:doublesex- and mab-3-related transcription factor C1-like n=1 Tax=Mus pahari TaxID=10093 RepID=UPI000A30FB5E